MDSKKKTIKDVAEKAGTSVATVSRVLSNKEYPVSYELRQKVMDAANELGFISASSHKSSRNGQQHFIGLIVPTVTNPFYMLTIQGISGVCLDSNYQLIFCNSQWSTENELRYLQDLYAMNVGGVILSPVSDSVRSISEFERKGMKFVLLDQQFENDSSSNMIAFDNKKGAEIAVRYLQENGHERIAFISTQMTRWTRKKTYEGYLGQMRSIGVKDDSLVYIIPSEDGMDMNSYELEAGRVGARRLVESGCAATAVFCVNDMVAFGVISELTKQGLRIPEDISVVGFDDIPFSQSFVPALTTVRCASYETGRLAAMMLIDRMQSIGSENGLNLHLSSSLIVRDTVKNLNKR